MYITRLELKNWRRLLELHLEFKRGINLIYGPNEIGKSSLAEAIDRVFDELDSTTTQRVRDVQPVDRDAGAEIEVDVETGRYAFTCSKRFQRRAATELRVTRPAPEQQLRPLAVDQVGHVARRVAEGLDREDPARNAVFVADEAHLFRERAHLALEPLVARHVPGIELGRAGHVAMRGDPRWRTRRGQLRARCSGSRSRRRTPGLQSSPWASTTRCYSRT